MTDQTTTAQAPAQEQAAKAAHTVVAQEGTRLAQLQASYADLKAAADAANEQLKACTDAIKLELSQAAPGEPRVTLAQAGDAPAFALTYVESWRVDARKLKAEDPETYVRFAKKSGAWTLRPVAGMNVGDE